MAGTSVIDGSNIRQLVEDEHAFQKYVDGQFDRLDRSSTGTLSKQELQPIVRGIGQALGLPPKGSAPETDHVYDQVMREFVADKGDSVSKEKFKVVFKDILLGLAEGLEREPIKLILLNGSGLGKYVEQGDFEANAVSEFTSLDTESRGKIKGSAILKVLEKISVYQGCPPCSDKTTKMLIDKAFEVAGVDPTKDMNQEEFIDALKKVLMAVSALLKQTPLMTAYAEHTYDGSNIEKFLSDKEGVLRVLDEAWKSVPKDKKAATTKDFVMLGLDTVASSARLPPSGVLEEVDKVKKDAFSLIDSNDKRGINEENFKRDILQMLSSMMLQFQGQPITISRGAVVPNDGRNPDLIV